MTMKIVQFSCISFNYNKLQILTFIGICFVLYWQKYVHLKYTDKLGKEIKDFLFVKYTKILIELNDNKSN
jgi:hypothetical protein